MKKTLVILAMILFEIVTYFAVKFAVNDISKNNWFSVLTASAFCMVDFLLIVRIFAREKGEESPSEVWYTLAGWFLFIAFKASLIWWGVSVKFVEKYGSAGSIPILFATATLIVNVILINALSVTFSPLRSRENMP